MLIGHAIIYQQDFSTPSWDWCIMAFRHNCKKSGLMRKLNWELRRPIKISCHCSCIASVFVCTRTCTSVLCLFQQPSDSIPSGVCCCWCRWTLSSSVEPRRWASSSLQVALTGCCSASRRRQVHPARPRASLVGPSFVDMRGNEVWKARNSVFLFPLILWDFFFLRACN